MHQQANNKKEAEAIQQTYKDIPLPFCPIINEVCKQQCVCYKEAYMSTCYKQGGWKGPATEDDVAYLFYVYSRSCTHVLIMGEIQIIQ